jgi:hypothetical protein
MIRDELHQFFRYNEEYKNMCCELLDSLHLMKAPLWRLHIAELKQARLF